MVEIFSDPQVTAESPVLVILPGCGGELKDLVKLFGKAPQAAWYIACDIGDRGEKSAGNAWKRDMPECVVELLRKVNAWGRKAIIVGFSRGGHWGIELCTRHVRLLSGAVLVGAYPETRDAQYQVEEAENLMQVDLPILTVHGLRDACCTLAYPKWHARQTQAMLSDAPPPHRRETFTSVTVPGVHDGLIWRAFSNLSFNEFHDPKVDAIWAAMFVVSQ